MNQQAMLRKVRQMQKEMLDAQKEIESTEFTVKNNVVTVIVMGNKELKSVEIDPEFEVEGAEDLEILGDMIVAATNEALRKASETMEQKMGGVTSGLGLPAGFGF